MVKRLRHGPFTAVTWVRVPYGSPKRQAQPIQLGLPFCSPYVLNRTPRAEVCATPNKSKYARGGSDPPAPVSRNVPGAKKCVPQNSCEATKQEAKPDSRTGHYLQRKSSKIGFGCFFFFADRHAGVILRAEQRSDGKRRSHLRFVPLAFLTF